tara:strand:- start:542 stop:721 length:180 start_codon:yes stop_codon:yes gene_type:complete
MIEHLKENNISYCAHFKKATHIGIRMMVSGLCCCIHAFVPFAFTDTASDTIKKINEEIT